MEKTPHNLLAGTGATKFAHDNGIAPVDDEELITDSAREALDEFLHGGGNATSELNANTKKAYGTVGAVAVNSEGHVVCATSTGGITGKLPGRVGDSPLVGCGAYCEDGVGGCSATGHGESIARVTLCRHIISLMDAGLSASEATEKALSYMEQRVGGIGGAIALSKKGDIGYYWTSKRMAWAYVKGHELHSGIDKNDDFISELAPLHSSE